MNFLCRAKVATRNFKGGGFTVSLPSVFCHWEEFNGNIISQRLLVNSWLHIHVNLRFLICVNRVPTDVQCGVTQDLL